MTKQAVKTEYDVSNRMWACASFVGVLIIIGLPLWWKTTEVYRVALPYDKIESFNSLAHYVTAELTVLANDEATAAEIAGLVEKAFEDSDVIKLKVTKSVLPEALHRSLEYVADEYEAVEEVGAEYPLSEHNKFYLVQRRVLFQDVWLAGERVMFFRDAKASQTAVSALKQWVYQTHILSGARAVVADDARRVRFPPADHYTILVHTDYELNMEKEFYDYIGSFADELSDLHNFTITMQSMYMLNFNYNAREVKDSPLGRHFAMRQSNLPLLLTKLEETAPRVPSKAAINLALCRLPCSATPLYIYDDYEKPITTPIPAFMSPKWGGVVFHSPSASECESGAWKPDVRLIMGAFVAQLRALLGIVDTPPIPGAYLEPLRAVAPRAWERDTLLRLRTLEHITAAERTLQSLAQLLGEISNIVINDEVGASINAAVQHTQQAATLAYSGHLPRAYRTALQGAAAAETAFMEPSLLALLYFPDDQKYAIYIPLFLPIMFPVFLSLKNLIAWLRGKPLHKEKTE